MGKHFSDVNKNHEKRYLLPFVKVTYFTWQFVTLNKGIKWRGNETWREKAWGMVIIGCISHICGEKACREATCSVKCNLQWLGLCDCQHHRVVWVGPAGPCTLQWVFLWQVGDTNNTHRPETQREGIRACRSPAWKVDQQWYREKTRC